MIEIKQFRRIVSSAQAMSEYYILLEYNILKSLIMQFYFICICHLSKVITGLKPAFYKQLLLHVKQYIKIITHK